MANVNKVILLGRVGQDPEIRTFDDGGKIANFSLATSERYTDRNGDKIETTEWHNIVANGRFADLVDDYVRKGDQLYVEGKLRTRSWETQRGEKRYTTEIIIRSMEFFSSGRRDESPAPAPSPRTERRAAPVRGTAPQTPPQRQDRYEDFPGLYDNSNDLPDLPF